MLPDGLVSVGLHPLLSQLWQLCTHPQVPQESHPDALLSCHGTYAWCDLAAFQGVDRGLCVVHMYSKAMR
jgi:hypothetical protein